MVNLPYWDLGQIVTIRNEFEEAELAEHVIFIKTLFEKWLFTSKANYLPLSLYLFLEISDWFHFLSYVDQIWEARHLLILI